MSGDEEKKYGIWLRESQDNRSFGKGKRGDFTEFSEDEKRKGKGKTNSKGKKESPDNQRVEVIENQVQEGEGKGEGTGEERGSEMAITTTENGEEEALMEIDGEKSGRGVQPARNAGEHTGDGSKIEQSNGLKLKDSAGGRTGKKGDMERVSDALGQNNEGLILERGPQTLNGQKEREPAVVMRQEEKTFYHLGPPFMKGMDKLIMEKGGPQNIKGMEKLIMEKGGPPIMKGMENLIMEKGGPPNMKGMENLIMEKGGPPELKILNEKSIFGPEKEGLLGMERALSNPIGLGINIKKEGDRRIGVSSEPDQISNKGKTKLEMSKYNHIKAKNEGNGVKSENELKGKKWKRMARGVIGIKGEDTKEVFSGSKHSGDPIEREDISKKSRVIHCEEDEISVEAVEQPRRTQ